MFNNKKAMWEDLRNIVITVVLIALASYFIVKMITPGMLGLADCTQQQGFCASECPSGTSLVTPSNCPKLTPMCCRGGKTSGTGNSSSLTGVNGLSTGIYYWDKSGEINNYVKVDSSSSTNTCFNSKFSIPNSNYDFVGVAPSTAKCCRLSIGMIHDTSYDYFGNSPSTLRTDYIDVNANGKCIAQLDSFNPSGFSFSDWTNSSITGCDNKKAMFKVDFTYWNEPCRDNLVIRDGTTIPTLFNVINLDQNQNANSNYLDANNIEIVFEPRDSLSSGSKEYTFMCTATLSDNTQVPADYVAIVQIDDQVHDLRFKINKQTLSSTYPNGYGGTVFVEDGKVKTSHIHSFGKNYIYIFCAYRNYETNIPKRLNSFNNIYYVTIDKDLPDDGFCDIEYFDGNRARCGLISDPAVCNDVTSNFIDSNFNSPKYDEHSNIYYNINPDTGGLCADFREKCYYDFDSGICKSCETLYDCETSFHDKRTCVDNKCKDYGINIPECYWWSANFLGISHGCSTCSDITSCIGLSKDDCNEQGSGCLGCYWDSNAKKCEMPP